MASCISCCIKINLTHWIIGFSWCYNSIGNVAQNAKSIRSNLSVHPSMSCNAAPPTRQHVTVTMLVIGTASGFREPHSQTVLLFIHSTMHRADTLCSLEASAVYSTPAAALTSGSLLWFSSGFPVALLYSCCCSMRKEKDGVESFLQPLLSW